MRETPHLASSASCVQVRWVDVDDDGYAGHLDLVREHHGPLWRQLLGAVVVDTVAPEAAVDVVEHRSTISVEGGRLFASDLVAASAADEVAHRVLSDRPAGRAE